MARKPSVWFWQQRGCHYTTIDGTRHRLDPDKTVAQRMFHELMAQPPEPATPRDCLLDMLNAFDRHCEQDKAEKTARWYHDYLQSFLSHLKGQGLSPRGASPEEVFPKHVRRWCDDAKTARRARITAVKAAFRWGKAEGYMAVNNLAEMKRPAAGKREQLITPEDFKTLLGHVKDEEFRLLLEFSWETGCRPQESKRLLPEHLQLKKRRFVLPRMDSKGKRRPRVVYLNDRAVEILKGLLPGCQGPLFKNTRKRPWTAGAVKCRFDRLEKKIGKRYAHYAFRHSFVQRGLTQGVDPITLATLCGHASPSMIADIYSHLSQEPEHLLAAVRRISATPQTDPSPDSDEPPPSDDPDEADVADAVSDDAVPRTEPDPPR